MKEFGIESNGGKIMHPLARFDIQPENCETVKKLLNDNGYKESI